MNNKFSNLVMFIFGATIGSVATWQYAKGKTEQLIQDEINSVKEAFSQRDVTISKKQPKEPVKLADKATETKSDIEEYASKVREQGYINYSGSEVNRRVEMDEKKDKEGNIVVANRPYVISPEDFAGFDDYEKISLTYYADKILADDNNELVDDIDKVVGVDSLTRFGEYEDDSVFVRNDILKCYYEILLDHRKYSDVIFEVGGEKQYGVDD